KAWPFLVLAAAFQPAQSQRQGWFRQEPQGPMTNDFYAAAMVGPNIAIVVGADGEVARTTDGGGTWTLPSSGTHDTLFGVAFADATLGIAVGDNGTILRTDDGGASWTRQNIGISQQLTAVTLVDAKTGYIVGGGGIVLRTDDGGVAWTLLFSG